MYGIEMFRFYGFRNAVFQGDRRELVREGIHQTERSARYEEAQSSKHCFVGIGFPLL